MVRLLTRLLLLIPSLLFAFTFSVYAQGDFIYTNNNLAGSNSISAFSIGTNGVLTEIPGSPFLTGGQGAGFGGFSPNRIIVAGDFLFASNAISSDISVFSINPLTGSLTSVPGSPFQVNFFVDLGNGISIAITPDRKFLYAGDTNSFEINVLRINPDGSLSPVSVFPSHFGGMLGMKVSPNGKFLAVASFFTPTGLRVYSIGTDGSLTPVGPAFNTATEFATNVDFNCTSSRLFLGEHSAATSTEVFSVALDGSLTPIPGSPFIQASGNIGESGQVILLSPDERFLLVSGFAQKPLKLSDFLCN